MKNLILLIVISTLLSACGRSGMSADVTGNTMDTQVQVPATIPDFDFTDSTPEPDLVVPTPDQVPDEIIAEIPDETTTTTTTTTTMPAAVTTTSTTVPTEPTATTTTTTLIESPSTTTTTLKEAEVAVLPPESGDPDFEPSQLVPGAKKEDFVGFSNLKPTIFFKAIVNENSAAGSCSAEDKVSIWTREGEGAPQELVKICKKNYSKCLMEGSCVITQGDQRYPLNIVGWSKAYQRYIFTVIDVKRCPYGYGPGGKCLDPYYSVAADLSIYKQGDVIFVPAIVGLDMGNGTKHHGFFIIRDSGDMIKGRGRFDFFTGYHTDTDPKNLFKKFRLGDVNTNLKYYLLKNPGKLNTFVKKMRNYPHLPKSQLR